MFNNPRDAFGIALAKLGYSLNTQRKPAEWEAAYNELVRQKQVLYKYVNDEIYDLMIGETCWIAPYYSGDGALMIYDDGANEDIAFFVPETGTNFFVDAMCVRSTTKHQAEAEAYINFLCRPEVAAANAEYIGYSCPEPAAMELMDPEVTENPYFYPPQEILDNTEVFLNLPKETNKPPRGGSVAQAEAGHTAQITISYAEPPSAARAGGGSSVFGCLFTAHLSGRSFGKTGCRRAAG